jgi:nitrous oxide reductase accessory protein NosL
MMKNRKLSCIPYILIIFLLTTTRAPAGEVGPAQALPKDRCPVCGMFVAKYPDFLAQIVYTDDSRVFFDGVKDLLKYYFNLKKYSPGKTPADMEAIYVTDYYRLEFIDGRQAWYVLGSDVYGPMGKELIPFEKKTEALEFKRDHRATAVLTFEEIDLNLVKGLD